MNQDVYLHKQNIVTVKKWTISCKEMIFEKRAVI